MRFRFIFWIFLMYFPLVSFAQKVKVVSGEYLYYVPGNVTLEEAKEIALDRAKIQIIADEFGTIIGSFSTTRVNNSSVQSDVDYFSLSDSEVKGEWIETIGEPIYHISFDNDLLFVKVSVKGRIREIVSAPIDFKARVLCNGTEDRFERYDFRDGDDLFLSFLSPVSGFLTIYLYDGDENVYCLLPYRQQTDGIVQVKAGKRYVFFSLNCSTDGIPEYLVDEYVLTASKAQESNRIYIIFSTNQFYKAVDFDSADAAVLPRQLKYKEFQKWLVKNRKLDNAMRVEVKNIIIKGDEQ